ncbi:MAG: type III ribulose-bisphosphate carboxylase [Candidatus Woesebacteria bacterium]|nr:type III ribulose-bisphosphate carboxylase [Candidatus Woesebacteria bacterium]
MSHYLDFVDLNYKPTKNDLICLFRFEPASGVSVKECAGRIAAESSNGTWSATQYGSKPHIRKIRGRTFKIKGNLMWIAYPLELFELGSMPQLLSSVAGNIFGMKAVKNLRLEDIQFPEKYVKSFRGPQFGINGIKRIMKIKDRPLTATVPKPKLGMPTKEYVDAAKKIWSGGVDFVKTDENMTSQRFVNFYKNTEEVLKARDKIESKTGERKAFLANVTAETKEMLKRANFVKECGGEFVMVDFLTAGFAGFQSLRNECDDLGLALYLHRAFHASFTRNRKHGMSMLTVAKLARLIGGDTIHIGTVIGKLVGPKDEVLAISDNMRRDVSMSLKGKQPFLKQKWYNLKPTLPVSSGGLHPGIIPDIINLLGKDTLLQIGGGVMGNPLGIEAGAKAVRQAIEASLKGIALKEYAKDKKELKAALDQWGYTKPI